MNTPTDPHRFESTVGGYVVERELGRGGMATVYLARDIRHKRVVALKVLAPALGAALGPDRFRREIELAAQLQHPHIVPVFDSGEDGELLWYTMPFVDGESLRDQLKREGPLDLTHVLSIVREVASALDYAHRKGVVHRDIKPENILLSDGQALVADFGIARIAGPADERLTVTGLSLGTPSYMSPEQITGDAVDGRADQYALGCLVYELLAGRAPYAGPSAQAVIAKHMTDAVPLLRQARPEVSAATEAAVARAMAKSPAARFSSVAHFAGALVQAPGAGTAATTARRRAPAGRRARLVAGAVTIALLAIGGVWWSRRGGEAGSPAHGPQVVAIQPFTTENGHSIDYLTAGVTNAVRVAFVGIGEIRAVAAANRADTSRTPQQLAGALDAGYVLTGRIRRLTRFDSAGGVDVEARLLRGSDGRETWRGTVAASSEGLSSIGGRVAEAVAPALGQRLTDSVRGRLTSPLTRSALAYDAYLRGQAAEGGIGAIGDPSAEYAAAAQHFEEAVAIDTAFAAAWAELALAVLGVYNAREAKAEDPPRALAAARRAIAIEPRNPLGHLALGRYYESIDRNPDAAVREYGTARQLAPDDEGPLRALASAEVGRANWPTAIMLYQQLIKLQPDDVQSVGRLASAMSVSGRFAEAAALAERALRLSSGNLDFWSLRTVAAIATGDSTQVRAVILRARRAADPAELAVKYACVGWSWTLDDSSRALLGRLRPAAFGDQVDQGRCRALNYWIAGDTSRARALVDSVLPAILEEEHDPATMISGVDWAIHAVDYALLGRRKDAERAARRGEQISPLGSSLQGVVTQLWLVKMDVVLGDREAAVQRIARVKAIDPGWISSGELRLNPLYDSLRDLPSFRRLLAAVAP